MLSRAWHRLHVFLPLAPALFFPRLAPVAFSPLKRFHVFPPLANVFLRKAPVVCFSRLAPVAHRLRVFPPLASVACFPPHLAPVAHFPVLGTSCIFSLFGIVACLFLRDLKNIILEVFTKEKTLLTKHHCSKRPLCTKLRRNIFKATFFMFPQESFPS